jgi:sirohydrochlorin cobaltochelatase
VAAHAIILFAHGARDARWSMTLVELQKRVQARRPDAHVGIAFLEFQPPELGTEIERAIGAGARAIDVLPVFWANGGHMASDVPPLLAELRRRHPGLDVRLLPVLSELPGMLDFIARAVARGG